MKVFSFAVQIWGIMTDYKNGLKVILTDDLSATIYNPNIDETYHSSYGALQESMHVFIKNGFHLLDKPELNMLEIGLGTGLNAALTWKESSNNKIKTSYTAIEAFPLDEEILKAVAKSYDPNLAQKMTQIDQCHWDKSVKLDEYFYLTKYLAQIHTFNFSESFDLIYYDAFAPAKQPDMWTPEIFSKLYEALNLNGILTTYCAKGEVKRNLIKAGFTVKSVQGPKGKREMTLAYKLNP